MTRIARLLSLPMRDIALLAQAATTVIAVRLALPFSSAERLRRWAGRFGQGTVPSSRIVWAVALASRNIAGTKCLAAALSLQRLLSANGISSELRIGVGRHDRKFGAHAWVVKDDEILIGEEAHQQYTVLACWRTGLESTRDAGGAV